MMNAAYRPRNPGHDYHSRGIYLVTLVVSGRKPLLGTLGRDVGHPSVALTPLGLRVQEAWQQIPARQQAHGNHVAVHACVCMPEHFHGVIEVQEPMAWSLGDIIQAFKATCTRAWQALEGLDSSSNRPISVDCTGPDAPAWLREKATALMETTAAQPTEGALVRSLSHKQRREYYTLVGRCQQPLFDENYDDTVCLDSRHRDAMIAYVQDNPRRAILRRTLPDVLQRSLHLQIGSRSYGAFGNLFLLRWANKLQVQCHRRHPVTGQPYETTPDYARDHAQWLSAILGGQTVIVTPGISRGELLMKNECLERGYPLIHLQKEAIGPFWKPERQRFEACANGNLLILAPWGVEKMEPVAGVPADTDYSQFHNLNAIAAELCAFNGQAKIVSV